MLIEEVHIYTLKIEKIHPFSFYPTFEKLHTFFLCNLGYSLFAPGIEISIFLIFYNSQNVIISRDLRDKQNLPSTQRDLPKKH